MLKKGLTVLALTLFTGCNSMSGTLSVTQTLKFNYTPYSDGSPAVNVKVLDPGNYPAQLAAQGKNKLVLTIKAGSKMNVPFEVPGGVTIPSGPGEFRVSANNNGQAFDLAGTVAVKTTTSDPQRGVESCFYQRQEEVCSTYPNPYGNNVCTIQWVTVSGQREVEYRLITTDKTTNVDIFDSASSSTASASFEAEKVSQDRDYLFKGPCY